MTDAADNDFSDLQAPQQADIAEAQVMVDRAKYAYLCTAVVHYRDLTFNWANGTTQRTLEQGHVNRLKAAYVRDNGPDRKSAYRYLRVAVSRQDMLEYLAWKAGKDVPWESFTEFARKTKITLKDWSTALNGKKIEVEVGQHRMNALLAYLTEKNPEATEEEINEEAWWYADVYDIGKYPFFILFYL